MMRALEGASAEKSDRVLEAKVQRTESHLTAQGLPRWQ